MKELQIGEWFIKHEDMQGNETYARRLKQTTIESDGYNLELILEEISSNPRNPEESHLTITISTYSSFNTVVSSMEFDLATGNEAKDLLDFAQAVVDASKEVSGEEE